MAEAEGRKGRGCRGRKKKSQKAAKKKVRCTRANKTKTIDRTESEEAQPSRSHLGGAIRAPRLKNVKIDKRDTAFTKHLYSQWDDDDEDPRFADHEVSMYSHYGGRLSGHGARGDSPRTVRFMHNTFKQHPEILAAYHSGKVANLSEEVW